MRNINKENLINLVVIISVIILNVAFAITIHKIEISTVQDVAYNILKKECINRGYIQGLMLKNISNITYNSEEIRAMCIYNHGNDTNSEIKVPISIKKNISIVAGF